MTGRFSGLKIRIKEIAFGFEPSHCIILKEMQVIRKLSSELNSFLQDVINIINHINVRILNAHLFDQPCEETDAEHKHLLLYTEVRWLSSCKSLIRVFELKVGLQGFLREKVTTGRVFKHWVSILAYMCDVFNLFNEFNFSLQGKITTAFKVAAFKAKLEFWGQKVNAGTFDMFHAIGCIIKLTEIEP